MYYEADLNKCCGSDHRRHSPVTNRTASLPATPPAALAQFESKASHISVTCCLVLQTKADNTVHIWDTGWRNLICRDHYVQPSQLVQTGCQFSEVFQHCFMSNRHMFDEKALSATGFSPQLIPMFTRLIQEEREKPREGKCLRSELSSSLQ